MIPLLRGRGLSSYIFPHRQGGDRTATGEFADFVCLHSLSAQRTADSTDSVTPGNTAHFFKEDHEASRMTCPQHVKRSLARAGAVRESIRGSTDCVRTYPGASEPRKDPCFVSLSLSRFSLARRTEGCARPHGDLNSSAHSARLAQLLHLTTRRRVSN